MQRADGFSTLAISHSLSTAHLVPQSRLKNLTILGALIALLMIHGFAPDNFDPTIIQYIVHDEDLEAVHPTFLGEWHPELRKTILDWKDLGPNGDPTPHQAHFSIYHDMQVGV